MHVLKFPETDIILGRLEKVEEILLESYESMDSHLNLDTCLASLQTAIHHYKLFIGVVEAIDSGHDQGENKEN